MITRIERAAATLVRLWTRLYTRGLPPQLLAARRAEIESDLWESAHDPRAPRGTRAAVLMCARLTLGMPSDLLWRAAHTSPLTRRALAVGLTTTAAASVLAMLWVYQQVRPNAPLPPPPLMKFAGAPPPPPQQ
jgi:hypothetical protein